MVSLDQLVKEVVAEIGLDISGRDVVWKIDSLPVCYGDRSMLRLVFVNLLSNAVKFTRTRAQGQAAPAFDGYQPLACAPFGWTHSQPTTPASAAQLVVTSITVRSATSNAAIAS
jgi:hypothetical protein